MYGKFDNEEDVSHEFEDKLASVNPAEVRLSPVATDLPFVVPDGCMVVFVNFGNTTYVGVTHFDIDKNASLENQLRMISGNNVSRVIN